MKTVLFATLALAAVSAPAMAHDPREVRYGQVDNRYDQRHYEQRPHRGSNKLAVCITERGVVIGTKRDCRVTSRYESRRLREIDAYNYRWTHRNNNPRECYQVGYRDYYGNIVTRIECNR